MMFAFVCLALFGAGFLILSALLGGDHDVGVDHDVDASPDHDSDHESGGHHWLSFKVLAGFVTLFGASGAIAKSFGATNTPSLIIAVCCGAVGGFFVEKLISFLYKQQSSSTFPISALIGSNGRVTQTILPGKFGEVSADHQGSPLAKAAKSTDPAEEIPQGTIVKIVQADANGFQVTTKK